MKTLEIISASVDVTYQLLNMYFVFGRLWKNKWEYDGRVRQLFIDMRGL
jgi:hypothetical protein